MLMAILAGIVEKYENIYFLIESLYDLFNCISHMNFLIKLIAYLILMILFDLLITYNITYSIFNSETFNFIPIYIEFIFIE